MGIINTKLKSYFLGTLSPEEVEEIELQIISNVDFASVLDSAETELIEDYLEKTLTAEETKLFETNFLTSEERQKRVDFLRSLKQFAQSASQDFVMKDNLPSFFESIKDIFAPRKFVFGGLALVLVVGVSGYFIWKNYTGRSEVLVSLNKVYKNERPLDSRITGFDYAPKTEGTRGNDKTESLDLVSAKASAAYAVLKNPNAENLHELGQVFLAERNFDEAIKQFEKAVKLSSNNAKLRNDLGVALLEKARILNDGNLENFAKANEELSKAIELDNSLLEAYFNRALCIQNLNLPNQAKEAWEEYLKLDSKSQWAEEAKKRLQELETNKPVSKTKDEILKEFFEAKQVNDTERVWQILSRNREMITGKLIPQQLAFLFVEAKSVGDKKKAQESLDALVYAGKVEGEKSGDLLWRNLGEFYANISDDKISLLKQAQDSFRKGNDSCLKGNYRQAWAEYEAAETLFLKAKNNFEPNLTGFMISYCKIRLGEINESIKQLTEITNVGKKNNYKWLSSQALQWLGINARSVKQFSGAIEYFDEAFALSKQTNDDLGTALILMSISDTYSLLGQYTKSLEFTQKNLEIGKSSQISLRQKWRNLYGASKVFQQIKFFRTAILYESESLALASEHLNEKTFDYTNYVNLGLIYGKLGEFEKSYDFIQKGQELSESFSDPEYRKLCFAYTNLKLGHIRRQAKNYQQASENYRKAIEFYDSDDFQVSGYESHKGLLLNYLAEKNDEAFQQELPNLINIFNEYRTKIIEEQNRNSFFDNEQDVYDIAIDYEFGKGNFAKALDYAEESRSRSLLDLQNSVVQVSTREKQPEIKFSALLSKPRNLVQIQAEMPENTQLLVYSVLTDKILIWSVTKNGLETARTEISSDDLQEKITNYLELISKNDEPDEQLKLSKQLYQTLLSPIEDKLEINRQIFIIPDKVLFRLPFATLYNGKYLIEDYKISYSPSANVFLHCSKKAGELSGNISENLLSIGNPAFNQTEYKDILLPLPSAKNEAEEIAGKYENSLVFTEKSATKEKIKENLKKSDVVHFAGHYLVDEKTPLLSSFVLAGTKKEESNLANYEIIGERFSRTRLIVLSACETGIEKYYKGEGMIGASRTFLATDVPLVVASQWSVDSEATKELMIRFHNFRKEEKLSTVEALRQAQLAMLKDEKLKQPYYWAAFMTLGGYADF